MKYTEAFARCIKAHGVDVMFGVLGDANMYLGDAYVSGADPGRFVKTAHEAGAVLMAAGYAAVSGKVGVATVTHGAITNCVGALAEATRGRYPTLLIAGDTARLDEDHLQNLPHREIVAPSGAHFMEARSPDTVYADIGRAIRRAVTQRTAVVLNIPSDFQFAQCDPEGYNVTKTAPPRLVPDPEAVEQAAALLVSSRRPVLLAGRGAGEPGAEKALLALAERVGAPTATSLRGKGLFRSDPFNLGIWGTLSTPVASEAIAACDLVIAFGASLSPLTTMKGELVRGKKVIQVDHDAGAIGRYFHADVGIVGNMEDVAQRLVALLDEAEAPAAKGRSESLREKLAGWCEEDLQPRDGDGLDIRDALHQADSLAPRSRTLSIDAGRFAHEALRIMSVEHPSRYVHALNVSQIGMSLSCAIGASIGDPTVPAVVVQGDGGFMLGGLTEFNTAVRYGCNVIVFVVNDGAYGAEYYRFVAQSMNTELVTFDWPDLAEVARSLGGIGVTVTRMADFARVRDAIAEQARKGPLLVDIRIDRDRIPDPGAH